MAVLYLSEEVYEDEQLVTILFSHLRREYNARISRPIFRTPTVVKFRVDGDGIPSGKTALDIVVKELIPNVLIIDICNLR